MYVSKLFIQNFRSFREGIILFKEGKNVILGKNNSGKSNIIRALDILLSEKFPTYQTISDNDYFTQEIPEIIDIDTGEVIQQKKENVADNFYIEVTIEGKDFFEENILSIKKKSAFSKVNSIDEIYSGEIGDIKINYEFLQNLNDIEERSEIAALGDRGFKTKWFTADELLALLSNSRHIKLFFTKNREDDNNSFGIIIIDATNNVWISQYFPKKLRDSLITTSVISALRSTKDDLRMVYYTWFGKFIKNLWDLGKVKIDQNENKSYENLINEKTFDIKKFVDTVFEENTREINRLLKKAISHKEVSFKLLDDSREDVYKSIQVFVNDGIDRPLTQKGTGIQSAMIIALFTLYCDKFHNRSSLLIAEEPELYLHPQARRLISAEFEKYLSNSESQYRQLMVSTHSTEFIKDLNPSKIVRVNKDEDSNESVISQLSSEASTELGDDITRILSSGNSEIFFADKVLLVEGGEVYLLPTIIDIIKEEKQYLDYNNISIARVDGKGNFLKYIKMLNEFNIEWIVVGDLDCYKEHVKKILDKIDKDIDVSFVKDALKGDVDQAKLTDRINSIESNYDVQHLLSLFEKFATGSISNTDPELVNVIDHMKSRYTQKVDLVEKLGEDYKHFCDIQNQLREQNIFIWSHGCIEDYYTDYSLALSGSKDLKAINISYGLQEDNNLEKYIKNIDEFIKLCSII